MSARAGSLRSYEGMNVSSCGRGLKDAYNLGWKLARVLRHGASTQLLWTYSEESQQAAGASVFIIKPRSLACPNFERQQPFLGPFF